MRNGINHTDSPLGREADQLCPPTEDLKDFLSSKKTFKSGEDKAGSIKLHRLLPIPCLRKSFMTD